MNNTSSYHRQIRAFQKSRDCPKFTEKDYLIVRGAMDLLSASERLVIEMRFFRKLCIDDIAMLLHMSWGEVDDIIDNIQIRLGWICMDNPEFSRFIGELQSA